MTPIMCVGETLDEREAGETEAKVQGQVKAGLGRGEAEQVGAMVIAYEPIWAIGTGRPPPPTTPRRCARLVRSTVAESARRRRRGAVRVQYGGSVKPGNAPELMAQPDIDGALVGGPASRPTTSPASSSTAEHVEGLYGVSAATEFFPELLAQEGEVTENDDGSVSIDYTLRDGLTWSDGEAFTSEDVEFTWNILSEGCETEADGSITDDSAGCVYLIGSRQGYDRISAFEVVSDTEFTITFASFFAGWPSLFNRVMPAHAFGDGAGAEEVNQPA
jgi:ABC-type transport system substrate-binding protein